MKSNKIKEARGKTGRKDKTRMSQSDLAEITGISQAQISRYEEEDYDLTQLTVSELKKLSNALGESVDWLIQDWIDAEEIEFKIDWCKPYEDLHFKNGALLEYIKMKQVDFSKPISNTIEEFKKVVHLNNIPPITISLGPFDGGKSFLGNKLVGKEILGVGYQPETVMVTFLVHDKFKPKGFDSDTAIYGQGFDFLGLISGDLQEEICILKPEIEEIKNISIGDKSHHNYEVAVIFMDSPILESTILCDTPGFAENLDDTNAIKALRSVPYYDNILFLTPLASAFDQNDKSNIKSALAGLPLNKYINTDQSPFANITFLVTHSFKLNTAQETRLKQKASKNIYEYFADMREITRIEEMIGRRVTAKDFENRIKAFWFEDKKKRESLEAETEYILCNLLPSVKKERCKKSIRASVDGMERKLKSDLIKYERLLDQREQMKKGLDELEAFEPERKQLRKESLKSLHLKIDEHENDCQSKFDRICNIWLDKEFIENHIRTKFEVKKVAQKSAANYFSDRMIDELNQYIGERSKLFSDQVEEFLEGYSKPLESAFEEFNTDEQSIGFDVRGAFIAGFSSAASLGAFSFWAASLGNLGGYIISAKLVSILSALGISLGGTAAVNTFLTTIGGPVTLFIALSVLIGTLTWTFFGESWQSRLAKRVVKSLSSKDYQEKVSENLIKDFWKKTHNQLEISAENLEREYQEYIREMREDINSMDEKKIKSQIEKFQKGLDFFGNAPFYGRNSKLSKVSIQ